jgi:hypothetical protein
MYWKPIGRSMTAPRALLSPIIILVTFSLCVHSRMEIFCARSIKVIALSL